MDTGGRAGWTLAACLAVLAFGLAPRPAAARDGDASGMSPRKLAKTALLVSASKTF